MKKTAILLLLVALAGCAYMRGEKSLLEDPQFTEYRKNMDELESSYLRGEMKYSEYIEKRKEVEDKYDQAANKRNQIVESASERTLPPAIPTSETPPATPGQQ